MFDKFEVNYHIRSIWEHLMDLEEKTGTRIRTTARHPLSYYICPMAQWAPNEDSSGRKYRTATDEGVIYRDRDTNVPYLVNAPGDSDRWAMLTLEEHRQVYWEVQKLITQREEQRKINRHVRYCTCDGCHNGLQPCYILFPEEDNEIHICLHCLAQMTVTVRLTTGVCD